jgi:hypothetical protein
MLNHKIRIEVFEGDPFSSACCGPGPAASSPEAIEKTRQMLAERSQIVARLRKEFEDTIQVEREIVSPRRWDYPEHVRRLMFDNERLPYIFINSEAVATGSFPSYEEFANLIKPHLKDNKKDGKANET